MDLLEHRNAFRPVAFSHNAHVMGYFFLYFLKRWRKKNVEILGCHDIQGIEIDLLLILTNLVFQRFL